VFFLPQVIDQTGIVTLTFAPVLYLFLGSYSVKTSKIM